MKIRINDFILENPKIDKNIKIVLISDIHNNEIMFDGLLKAIKKIRPQYICIPGDTLDRVNSDYNKLLNFIKNLAKISKVIISLGNHDVLEYKNFKWSKTDNLSFFNELDKISNCIVLKDNFSIYQDKINFCAFNYPDEWYRKDKESRESLKNIMLSFSSDKIDDKKFNILLSHSSNAFVNNNKLMLDKELEFLNKFNLIFSGHNHGGLVPNKLHKLFKNRGIIGPYHKLFMANSFGNWTDKNTSLILSNGITKVSNSSSLGFVSNLLNRFYIPDIENILLKHGKKHKIVLNEEIVQ